MHGMVCGGDRYFLVHVPLNSPTSDGCQGSAVPVLVVALLDKTSGGDLLAAIVFAVGR